MSEEPAMDAEELRSFHGEPSVLARDKVLPCLDRHCREFIARSPFLVLGTADASRNEHQPREKLATRLGRVLRPELAGLLGEVEQDRVAVEAGGIAVDDGRRLAVGIGGQQRRLVLLALAGVDGHQLIRRARLLQEQRHLRGVGRRMVVELDHAAAPLRPAHYRCLGRNAGKSLARAAQPAAAIRSAAVTSASA